MGFEWWLEYNFYTYKTIFNMLEDVKKVTDLLQTDYDNPYLKPFKDRYSVFYMTDRNSKDYKIVSEVMTEDEKYQIHSQLINKNISVVIGFYNQFRLKCYNTYIIPSPRQCKRACAALGSDMI